MHLRFDGWIALVVCFLLLQVGAPVPARAASGPDLALGRPVAASTVQSPSYPPSAAVDGDPSTRWSSAFSDPQSIYVDLGAQYNISEVVLDWEVAYASAYQIQVSNDAVNWTTIYSTTTGTGGVDDLTGLSGTGRYVRMYGTARGTSWGYSLWEFSVYGSPTSSPPSSPASVPNHVETWATDDCGEGSSTPASLVQEWVSYAETNCGPGETKANTDCHVNGTTYCTTLAYFDPSWEWQSKPQAWVPSLMAAASENWWLHQSGYGDAAHRLAATCSGGVGYLTNQSNTALDNWFQNYARNNYNGWDGLLMDDTSGGISQQFYSCANPAYSTSQEISSDSQLQAAHRQIAGYMTHASGAPFLQVNNGTQSNPNLTRAWSLLNNPAAVHGLQEEGQPWDSGLQGFYSSLLDDMAYVDNNHPSGYFVMLDSRDPGGSPQGRRVVEATVLLGYSPGHVVDHADLELNSNNLAVWPEEGIYPTKPVQTMGAPGGNGCETGTGGTCSSGGHNDLEVASGTNTNDPAAGVYRREFGNCYNQSVSFGRCAEIVNDTSSAVTVQSSWLTQSYGHQITMNGGDVQSGGSINVAGAGFTAGWTTIPANDAILLSQ
jgi:hypothetical protein